MATNNFNYTSKTARIQIDDSQNVPNTPTPSLQNNTYLYGNRRNLVSVTFTGDTTSVSANILNIADVVITSNPDNIQTGSISDLQIGYYVTGAGIPANSFITAITGSQITISIAATATATGVSLTGGEVSLPIPVPQAGFPSYNYYQVYKLNDNLVADPDALLAWFSSAGYEVNYGYSGTQTLNGIGAFSPNPVVSGQCTLYFSGQSLNVQSIANAIVSGTFTISGTSITGTLVSITTGTFNPQITANFTGDTTSASTTVTNLNINANLLMVGSSVTGAGIPVGATIATIVSSSSITLSLAATATATGVALSYASLNPLSADTKIVINSTDYTGLQIGENLTINYVKQSTQPDINYTEPFIMNMWQGATAMQRMNEINQNATVGAPAVYFSILPNSSNTNYFSPSGTAMPLGVAPSVVAPSGNLVTITIPVTAYYASFIPSITLGASTISQATTLAVGTIFQSEINGNVMQIQLSSVTGTFNTSDLLTLTLDNTVNLMQLQQQYFANKKLSLRTLPCIYPINSNSDITGTYSSLFDYGVALNDPITANEGQGNCSVVFGNQTIPANLAVTDLPNAINNQFYEPVYVPFVLRSGVVNRTTAQTMCAMAMIFASNIYPFNPLNDIVIAGFDNSPYPQDWIDMSAGGVADQIINLGWNVIATDSLAQQYLFLGRTGQTTVNNVPDNEFYPSYVLDTKDYIRKAQILICRNNGVGQVRQTSDVLSAIDLDLVDLNNQMGDDGILSNVKTNNNLIRVTRSVNNPLGVSLYTPIQQTPALNAVYGEIVNYSIDLTLG